VKVFFVISGFVICRLLIREEEAFHSVSLKGFYIRRAFRILPPFLLYIGVLCLLLFFGKIHDSWRGLSHGALFLYDLSPAQCSSWFIGHTWSLAVEEQFYLIFPAVWVLAGYRGRRHVFPAIYFLIVTWNISTSLLGWDQITIPNARYGFACICCGVLIATFEADVRAMVRRIPAIVIAVGALSLFWHPADFDGWRGASYESIYMPLAIGSTLVFSLERGQLLRAVLCSAPAQAIGLSSYGIYLWQQLFTAPARFYTGSGDLIARLLPLLLVIVPLSHLALEKPAMRLGRRFAERVRRVPAPEEVTA
jgi:peptidoglycan/LPS O-acetylase OafA/YrhL